MNFSICIRRGLAQILLCVGILHVTGVQAQIQPAGNAPQSPPESRYDYVEAFRPFFYNSGGNSYRSASGKPGPAYWQNTVDYEIKAHLDERTREIQATVTLHYTNNSPDQLDFLWIQLDQNLFSKNSRGRQMLPAIKSRYGDARSDFDGGYAINAVDDGQGGRIRYEITDTRMQVFLDTPLDAQGGKMTLRIAYSYVVPEQGADRTGVVNTRHGPIFAIAQWFPRVAVYDDILGWNTHPYTGPGEFYLEYGNYDVEITVPASHIVAFGGELLNPGDVFTAEQNRRLEQARKSDQTVMIRKPEEVTDPRSRPQGKSELTWKFQLKNARDVAWASSPAFILDGARIRVSEQNDALALSAYPIESYGNNAWERSTEYTKASVEFYSQKWMEYPYPVAVNVAANLGGMEYPAISFCGYQSRGADLWGVTDHEFGHNWFPMIVGSNERLHGWMDEGLNTFINELSTEAFNNGEYHRPLGHRNRLALAFSRPDLEPIMTSPQNMQERNMGALVYYKPAFGLMILRNEILGAERFDRAFKAYIERWAYKHPTPDDFFRTIENVAGENLNWFWRGWFQHNWRLDQGIRSVSHPENNPANGTTIVVDNLEQLPMPLVLELRTKSGVVHRVRRPVEIWERNRSFTVTVPTTEEVIEVRIDPDQVFPDVNIDNNRWTATDGRP